MGFSARDCRSVTRAVDEALTNIIRHTYHGRPEQPIEVACRRVRARVDGRRREGLEIVLTDYGAAVDPKTMRGRSLNEIRPGGLGLHYIRQSMDAMEYKRIDRTNQLRLVKYLLPEDSNRVQ